MKIGLTLLAAILICGCAAQSTTTTTQSPTIEEIREAQRQAALHRLGEEREGIRQAGTATEIVFCWNCISDRVCDDQSKKHALEMRNQTCPSGKGHMTPDAVGTVRTARACTAKCYKFEMPAGSYACD